MADVGEIHSVDVHGARVEYRVWGRAGSPVVVLVHGGAAHAGWWDHVAPLLAAGRRVAALDLTGHGSSSTRQAYDFRTWADEIVAVGVAEAGVEDFHVIGHSMGGVAALVTAYLHAARLAGTVVIDPPDWLVVEGLLDARRVQLRPRRSHPSREIAAAGFRARPDDPARVHYVERHVASHSVRQTGDGWSWRFDPAVTGHDDFPEGLWGGEHGRMVLVLAERGLLSEAQAGELASRIGDVEVVTIHDSGHHVMLDQPLALTACLGGILAGWRGASEVSPEDVATRTTGKPCV